MILGALGSGRSRVLDVGCGEGILARELLRVAEHVTAIDLDPASIDLARQTDKGNEIEYLVGDFLTHPLAPASFDAIVSVAALHHMDARRALGRMRQLLRPAGRWPSSGSRAAASPLICLSTSPRSLSPPPPPLALLARLDQADARGVAVSDRLAAIVNAAARSPQAVRRIPAAIATGARRSVRWACRSLGVFGVGR